MNVGNLVGQDMGRRQKRRRERRERKKDIKDDATEAEGDKAKSRSGNDCCARVPCFGGVDRID